MKVEVECADQFGVDMVEGEVARTNGPFGGLFAANIRIVVRDADTGAVGSLTSHSAILLARPNIEHGQILPTRIPASLGASAGVYTEGTSPAALVQESTRPCRAKFLRAGTQAKPH
jgi:hypothetical protein